MDINKETVLKNKIRIWTYSFYLTTRPMTNTNNIANQEQKLIFI